jgi:carbonic anhydrase/acetyltransferase-like protein (isoleucine patch superfamily)
LSKFGGYTVIAALNGTHPKIGEGSFIAPGAVVIGDICLGKDVSIWFNCVARGDVAPIKIGDSTNIQDLCMLHVTDDKPLIIGKGVSVGHKATLHSCTIGDFTLVGMDAVILDDAVIGKNCLVAAGSVVSPGKVFPDGSMIMGAPAVVKRPLNAKELEGYGKHYLSYIETKNVYLNDKDFQSQLS